MRAFVVSAIAAISKSSLSCDDSSKKRIQICFEEQFVFDLWNKSMWIKSEVAELLEFNLKV